MLIFEKENDLEICKEFNMTISPNGKELKDTRKHLKINQEQHKSSLMTTR